MQPTQDFQDHPRVTICSQPSFCKEKAKPTMEHFPSADSSLEGIEVAHKFEVKSTEIPHQQVTMQEFIPAYPVPPKCPTRPHTASQFRARRVFQPENEKQVFAAKNISTVCRPQSAGLLQRRRGKRKGGQAMARGNSLSPRPLVFGRQTPVPSDMRARLLTTNGSIVHLYCDRNQAMRARDVISRKSSKKASSKFKLGDKQHVQKKKLVSPWEKYSKEEQYMKLIELRREATKAREDFKLMKTKVARLERAAKRKDEQVDCVLGKAAAAVTSALSREGGVWNASSCPVLDMATTKLVGRLQRQIKILMAEVKKRDGMLAPMRNDLRTTQLTENHIVLDEYRREITRLKDMLDYRTNSEETVFRERDGYVDEFKDTIRVLSIQRAHVLKENQRLADKIDTLQSMILDARFKKRSGKRAKGVRGAKKKKLSTKMNIRSRVKDRIIQTREKPARPFLDDLALVFQSIAQKTNVSYEQALEGFRSLLKACGHTKDNSARRLGKDDDGDDFVTIDSFVHILRRFDPNMSEVGVKLLMCESGQDISTAPHVVLYKPLFTNLMSYSQALPQKRTAAGGFPSRNENENAHVLEDFNYVVPAHQECSQQQASRVKKANHPATNEISSVARPEINEIIAKCVDESHYQNKEALAPSSVDISPSLKRPALRPKAPLRGIPVHQYAIDRRSRILEERSKLKQEAMQRARKVQVDMDITKTNFSQFDRSNLLQQMEKKLGTADIQYKGGSYVMGTKKKKEYGVPKHPPFGSDGKEEEVATIGLTTMEAMKHAVAQQQEYESERLKHAFIRKNSIGGEDSETQVSKADAEAMEEQLRDLLKQAVNVGSFSMEAAKPANDGSISLKYIKEALDAVKGETTVPESFVDFFVLKLDVNGDGHVDYRELLQSVYSHHSGECLSELVPQIKPLDNDNGGEIASLDRHQQNVDDDLQFRVSNVAGKLKNIFAAVVDTGAASDFRSIFQQLDQDGSGTLSRHEFSKALAEINFEMSADIHTALLDQFDADGDGSINYGEFLRFCESTNDTGNETFGAAEKVRRALKRVVAKNNAHFGKKDVQALFKEIDIDEAGSISIDKFAAVVLKWDTGLTKKDINSFAARFDFGGNGEVDFHQFLRFVFSERQDIRWNGDMTVLRKLRKIYSRALRMGTAGDFRLAFERYDSSKSDRVTQREFKECLLDSWVELSDSDIADIIRRFENEENEGYNYTVFLSLCGEGVNSEFPKTAKTNGEHIAGVNEQVASLDLHELKHPVAKMVRGISDTRDYFTGELKSVFDSFDFANSGHVHIDDFRSALLTLCLPKAYVLECARGFVGGDIIEYEPFIEFFLETWEEESRRLHTDEASQNSRGKKDAVRVYNEEEIDRRGEQTGEESVAQVHVAEESSTQVREDAVRQHLKEETAQLCAEKEHLPKEEDTSGLLIAEDENIIQQRAARGETTLTRYKAAPQHAKETAAQIGPKEEVYLVHLDVGSQQEEEEGQLKKETCPQLPGDYQNTAEPRTLTEETARFYDEDVQQCKDKEADTLFGMEEEDARVEEKETTLPFKEEEPLRSAPSEEIAAIKAAQKGEYQLISSKVAEEKFISDLKEEEEDIIVEKQLRELEKSFDSSSDSAYSEFSADEANCDDPKDFSSDSNEDGEYSNFGYDDDFE